MIFSYRFCGLVKVAVTNLMNNVLIQSTSKKQNEYGEYS